jgi:hypothetical protein
MDPEMVRQQRQEEALKDEGEALPPAAGAAVMAPLVVRAFVAQSRKIAPAAAPGDGPPDNGPPNDCSPNIHETSNNDKTPVESRGVLVIPQASPPTLAAPASASRHGANLAVYWLWFAIFVGALAFAVAKSVGVLP